MKSLTAVVMAALLGILALNPAESAPMPRPMDDVEGGDSHLLNLEFPGGTAAQYVDAIRHASNNANIVVIGELSAVNMPPVRLRDVDVWSAVKILNSLPQQQQDLLTIVEANLTSDEAGQLPVYTVQAQVTRADSFGAAVESTVMSVKDILGNGTTPEDLLTAMQIAVDVVGKSDRPAEIKFHKETGLLIARGSAPQIMAIRQVIEELRRQSNPQRAASPDLNQAFKQRDEQLAALQQRIVSLEQQISKLMSQ